jgi:hypothetical protein
MDTATGAACTTFVALPVWQLKLMSNACHQPKLDRMAFRTSEAVTLVLNLD